MNPFIPIIAGLAWLRKSSVGYDKSAASSTNQSSQAAKPAVAPPWFQDTRYVWPTKVALKEIALSDLVELATVAAKITDLASPVGEEGGYVVPLRDPALEASLAALLSRLGSTLRRMERSPIADAAFWQKFGAYTAIYAHYSALQRALDGMA